MIFSFVWLYFYWGFFISAGNYFYSQMIKMKSIFIIFISLLLQNIDKIIFSNSENYIYLVIRNSKASILLIMKTEKYQGQLQRLETIQQYKTPAQQYLEQRIKAPYKKHNAYTNEKSFPQIVTVIFFVLQIIFHSVYIAPFVYQINNETLNFFFILNYFVMCAVIGHYIYLTTYDPVDSLIVDVNQRQIVQKNSKQETILCIMCQKTVKKTSKHCYDCGRCTEEFDHHCSCLNNCIGLGNYQEFIRLLFFYQIFNGLTTIQAIWIIATSEDQSHGGEIFLIILNIIAFVLVLLLLIFHCYLNCYIRKPTFQFFKDRKNRKYELSDKVENKNFYGQILRAVIKDKKILMQKQSGEQNQVFQQNNL